MAAAAVFPRTAGLNSVPRHRPKRFATAVAIFSRGSTEEAA